MTPKTDDACGLTPARSGQKLVLTVMALFLAAVFTASFLMRFNQNPTMVRQTAPQGGQMTDSQMPPGQSQGDMDGIRELMRQLGENPDDPALNLIVAEEFLRIGSLEQAQHFLFTALVAEPGNGRVLHLLGLTEFELGEYGQAAGYFEELLRLGLDFPDAPAEADVHNILGVTYFRLDKLDQAGPQFERILEADPENALALLNLGIVYNHSGRPDEAKALFERVLAMDSAAEEVKDMARQEMEEAPGPVEQAPTGERPVDATPAPLPDNATEPQ